MERLEEMYGDHLMCTSTRKQVSALCKELGLIHKYVDAVSSDPHSPAAAVAGGGGDEIIIINDFLNHFASVIVLIEIQSCSFLFHCKLQTKIKLSELVVDWQHEIDSTNPKFMEFHLRFLIALCRIGGNKASFCRYFCDYVTNSGVGDFETELSRLVVLIVDSKLEQEEEDRTLLSFFAEITLLLVEAASIIKRPHKKEECSGLLIKICLFKTALFLKELLLSPPKISGRIFQIECQLDQIKYQFDQMLESLRRFSKDLRHQEAEKKTLALIEQVSSEVASLSELFGAKKITESQIRASRVGPVATT